MIGWHEKLYNKYSFSLKEIHDDLYVRAIIYITFLHKMYVLNENDKASEEFFDLECIKKMKPIMDKKESIKEELNYYDQHRLKLVIQILIESCLSIPVVKWGENK